MEIGLYGDVDTWTLRKLAERLRDRLMADRTITQVELSRVPDYMTHVEIPRHRLREYGITLEDVARLIELSSEDYGAGSVQASSGEVLLRVNERRQWAEEFGEIELLEGANGATVTLADIATVTDGFEEAGFHSRFNGTPSVELNIYRTGSQSPLEVSDAVRSIMADVEKTLPPGVQWRTDSDNAKDYEQRLGLLIENGLLAVVIVLTLLALFLEFRLAFWVMVGMTVSFIGGILLLPVVDVSINMITMFGFLVVLGIVVDDAIVVGENVYEVRRRHGSPLVAAIEGAREMAAPVAFSVISTVVAFIPLLLLPGETGKFWWPLPVVVILVLLVSLVEALFILPAHLAHQGSNPRRGRIRARLHRGQQMFSRGISWFAQHPYRRFLEACLRWRYITLSAGVAVFLVVGGYATSQHMGWINMPEVSADEIEAGVRLPVGTTQDQAARVAENVTAATARMFEEHDLYKVAEGIKTNVRGQNFVDVEVVMLPPDQRDMTAGELIEIWRKSIGDLPGIDQITFEAERGPGSWRPDIAVDLSHADVDVLERASDDFLQRAEEFSTTRDVNDNYNRGKTQYDFRLLPEGRVLGLTPGEVGAQLRGAFYGSLALRQLRGTNEVEIRVKLPEEQRKDLYHLEEFVLQTPSGTEVPLLEVVDLRRGEAFNTITRRDGRRVVSVSMDVEPKRAIGRVVAALKRDVLPRLRADYPGITWTFQGSSAEMRKSTHALWGWFGMALVLIYGLLAVAFGSYVQPLIVFCAIPFGIVGAIIGHMLLGYDISLVSLMGVVALSGVVVNDSLIMIDYANRNLGNGSVRQVILQAGMRRFRPIVLTSVTTFGGLTPVILEDSLQAQYLIPMAISLGFGIVFATAIILILVPCLYLVLEDLRALLGLSNDEAASALSSGGEGGVTASPGPGGPGPGLSSSYAPGC